MIGMMVRLGTIFIGIFAICFSCILWIGVWLLWCMGIILLPLAYALFILVLISKKNIPWQEFTHSSKLTSWLSSQSYFAYFLQKLGLSTAQINENLSLISQQNNFFQISPTDKDKNDNYPELAIIFILQQLAAQKWYQEWLASQGILKEDLTELISWQERVLAEKIAKTKFWDRDNLSQIKAIGKDWAYGFTPTLDQYATDIRNAYADELAKNVRPELISQIEQLFSKEKKTNILLVGEPGVGKHMLAYFLAKKIEEGKTTASLADHRVMELNLDNIVAETKDIASAIKLLTQIVNETIYAGNIILVINDFDRYVDNKGQNMDLSVVFQRVKDSNRVKLLAMVTSSQFSAKVIPNRKMYTSMEVIQVIATDPAQTLIILENLATHFEQVQGVLIQLPALQEIISKGEEVMTQIPFPDKGVTLLDECVSLVLSQNQKLVDREVVDKMLSARSGIPVGIWDQEYKEKLEHIEDYLHQRVIGQDPAISAVAKAIRRASVGLGAKDKTIGALLFLGTTGIGKTETAKALAELFFGSKEALVRVDFGEFSESASLRNLIGSPVGTDSENSGGQLTEAVRQRPYCVVLFDELEKAHPSILNALLTIFDEGYLTDARGEKISFRHTIIIATSNAVSDLIKNLLIDRGQTVDQATPEVINALITQKILLPEFINRFDSIVLYKPLSLAEIKAVTKLKLGLLADSIKNDQGITVTYTEGLLESLVNSGYSEQFGARYLERRLTELVTDQVTEAILNDKVKRGGFLTLQ